MTGARPFSHTQYAPCPGNFLFRRTKPRRKIGTAAVIVGKLAVIDRARAVAQQSLEKMLFL
jgi:hypothetical protein